VQVARLLATEWPLAAAPDALEPGSAVATEPRQAVPLPAAELQASAV
jgi:hypothetical protein